jgi:hypothetical protein
MSMAEVSTHLPWGWALPNSARSTCAVTKRGGLWGSISWHEFECHWHRVEGGCMGHWDDKGVRRHPSRTVRHSCAAAATRLSLRARHGPWGPGMGSASMCETACIANTVKPRCCTSTTDGFTAVSGVTLKGWPRWRSLSPGLVNIEFHSIAIIPCLGGRKRRHRSHGGTGTGTGEDGSIDTVARRGPAAPPTTLSH